MTDKQIIEYLEKHDLLHEGCKFKEFGCDGSVRPGGGGEPIYPPCCDSDLEYWFDINQARDYILENNLDKEIVIMDLKIKKVIFNEPATVVLWENGDKTVVKCQDGESFDKEKGLALAYMKYVLGNKGSYNNTIKKFV